LLGRDAATVEAAASAAVCVADTATSLAAGTDVGAAAWGGMKRDLVVGVQVDTFVNV
jgi:hypothetical protein